MAEQLVDKRALRLWCCVQKGLNLRRLVTQNERLMTKHFVGKRGLRLRRYVQKHLRPCQHPNRQSCLWGLATRKSRTDVGASGCNRELARGPLGAESL
jgi:hypothetical protein